MLGCEGSQPLSEESHHSFQETRLGTLGLATVSQAPDQSQAWVSVHNPVHDWAWRPVGCCDFHIAISSHQNVKGER